MYNVLMQALLERPKFFHENTLGVCRVTATTETDNICSSGGRGSGLRRV